MTGSPDPDDDQMSRLIELLTESRRETRIRHSERIQITFATIIVASYFTNRLQQISKDLGVTSYVNIIAILSIFYLMAQLIIITFRSAFKQYTETSEKKMKRLLSIFGSTFLYIIPLFSFLFIIMFEILSFQLELPPFARYIAFGIVIVLAISRILVLYMENFTILLQISQEDVMGSSLKVEELVINNPDVVEKGLKIEDNRRIGTKGPDFVGKDTEGNKVWVDVKTTTSIGSVRVNSHLLTELPEDTRFIIPVFPLDGVNSISENDIDTRLVSPPSVSPEFDESRMEISLIDPYEFLGRFGKIAKRIDSYFDIFDF